MLPVTFVYFCYGWTLWLFLTRLSQLDAEIGHFSPRSLAKSLK